MRINICLLFLAFTGFIAFAADDDNVIVESRTVDYWLKSDKGNLSSVKVRDESRYLARRADDRTVALTFYGDGITVDKAQAPDSKPIYRAWEDGDMFYTGSRVCALPFSLKKGKPAKVVFEKTYTQPEQFCQIMLTGPYQSEQTTFNIHVPTEIAERIKLTPKNMPSGVELQQSTDAKGDILYTVSLSASQPFKREALGASADMCAPQILISGYFADIDELYDFLRAKIDEDESTPVVDEFARSLCEGLDDDMAKIDTIASWVRNNIRYVAIEHGEYGLRPDDAESVLAKRYGDCKGSANLIRNMLKAVGIDGRLAWIGTRGNVPCTWTEIPSLAAGNHQIGVALFPDTAVFIDGTTAFSPKRLIPPSIAGQECMILNGDKVLVATVPSTDAESSMITLRGIQKLDGDNLKGDYEVLFSGVERMALESMLAAVPSPKRTAALQHLLSFDRQSVRQNNISTSTPALDAPVSTVVFDETDSQGTRKLSNGKTYVMMRPLRAATFDNIDVNGRRRPLHLSRKRSFTTDITFQVPENMSVESVPERREIKSPWFEGFIDYSVAQDGRTVVCHALLEGIRTDGPAESVTEWNDAVKQIKNASNNPIVLTLNNQDN